MKFIERKAYKNGLFLLMFVIILLVITNNIFFLHSHRLSDGAVIYHAHPFNKGNNNSGENHHHTNFEFLLLRQFQLFLSEDTLILPPIPFTLNTYPALYFNNYIAEEHNSLNSRAPPFYSFL